MCGCTGNGNAPASPVRASILRKPAGDIGACRSVVNTYRDGIASRWSLCRARSSPPPRVHAGHAVLDPPDVQQPVLEIHLIPPKREKVGAPPRASVKRRPSGAFEIARHQRPRELHQPSRAPLLNDEDQWLRGRKGQLQKFTPEQKAEILEGPGSGRSAECKAVHQTRLP